MLDAQDHPFSAFPMLLQPSVGTFVGTLGTLDSCVHQVSGVCQQHGPVRFLRNRIRDSETHRLYFYDVQDLMVNSKLNSTNNRLV